jgi:hypothetical protein
MSNLKLKIKTPLSDSDLERYLGPDVKDNVLTYSELKPYTDMNDLLPYDKSYKIILIEYEKNKGHWICMVRYNNKIEIFNSFGTKHDDDDFVESDRLNYYLGQSKLFLNRLIEDELKDGEFKIIYNKIKFQEKSKIINTCGRHVVNRILCLLHYNMTLKDYIKFMNDANKKTKFNYDEIVTKIIN